MNIIARSIGRHPLTDQIYELKNALIQYLYQHGYCTEVALHLQKRECYSCGGTGEHWSGEDCWKCNGSGIFSTTRLYAFRFSVNGKGYKWHQLEKLIDYPVTLTDPEPSPFVTPEKAPELLDLSDAWLGCCIVWWYLLLHGRRVHLLLFEAQLNYSKRKIRELISWFGKWKIVHPEKRYERQFIEEDDIPF